MGRISYRDSHEENELWLAANELGHFRRCSGCERGRRADGKAQKPQDDDDMIDMPLVEIMVFTGVTAVVNAVVTTVLKRVPRSGTASNAQTIFPKTKPTSPAK